MTNTMFIRMGMSHHSETNLNMTRNEEVNLSLSSCGLTWSAAIIDIFVWPHLLMAEFFIPNSERIYFQREMKSKLNLALSFVNISVLFPLNQTKHYCNYDNV